jgi:hypothetical protein
MSAGYVKYMHAKAVTQSQRDMYTRVCSKCPAWDLRTAGYGKYINFTSKDRQPILKGYVRVYASKSEEWLKSEESSSVKS